MHLNCGRYIYTAMFVLDQRTTFICPAFPSPSSGAPVATSV